MKKIIILMLSCLFFINIPNIAHAEIDTDIEHTNITQVNTNIVAFSGDYKINIITLNLNTFKINDFYYGQKLNSLFLFTDVLTINNIEVEGEVCWENPDYKLIDGYQIINLYFTNSDSNNKITFTIVVFCNKDIKTVPRFKLLP